MTKLSLGGECEGWLDCYIQKNFAQVQDFIKDYPDSGFTAEAVKRASDAFTLNLGNPSWIENHGPIKDYSVAQDSYDPVAIQKYVGKF